MPFVINGMAVRNIFTPPVMTFQQLKLIKLMQTGIRVSVEGTVRITASRRERFVTLQ